MPEPLILEDLRRELPSLCRRYRISTVDVFGSLANATEDEASDIDLVIEFDEPRTEALSARYFGFLHALEDRFHRKVDLLTPKSLHNPYFRRAVENSKVRIYG